MKQAFEKLNIYHKCSVLSGLFLIVVSLALIPLYFLGYKDIPLGLILGGIYGVVAYFVTGYLENKRGNYYKWAVLVSVFRYLLFIVLLIIVALCYYKWDIKIFNIFSVCGGYFICLVVLIILFMLKGRKENGSI